MRSTNRSLAALAATGFLLAACGGAAQSAGGSADASTAAEPSTLKADESGQGPASFMVVDPDGNPILFDQHV